MSTELDSQVIIDAVDSLDGTGADADGIVNGEVAIVDFGPNFDLRDLNGDGVISEDDIVVPLCPADLTGDGILNFFDVSAFLSAYSSNDLLADFTGDGVLNFFDVSAFLSAYNAQQPAADFTGDGLYNFFDVSAYLGAYNAGCP